MRSQSAVFCLQLLKLSIKILIESELFSAILPEAGEFPLSVTEHLVEMNILLFEFAIFFLVI